MSKEEKLMFNLGIYSTGRVRCDMPNYLKIALAWYSRYEESGENHAINNYYHYINLAEEFGFCQVEEATTSWQLREKALRPLSANNLIKINDILIK